MPCNIDWQIDKMASRSHKTVKPEHYNIPLLTQHAFSSIHCKYNTRGFRQYNRPTMASEPMLPLISALAFCFGRTTKYTLPSRILPPSNVRRTVLCIRAFRFAIRIDSFCKKSAFRFTITGFSITNNFFQCL